jgi:hypothetical protein
MVIYHRSQVRKLPRTVQNYMRYKFNLPIEYLGILRCLENAGAVSGNQATSISIFSPVRAHEHHLAIKTTADLGRYPEMVLFRGHFDNQGKVDIADQRGPVWGYKPERQ